jgi:hypothetical protein
MSLALLAGVFVASLLGSLHCAGMCGGIACFVGGTAARGRALTLYHLGRLLSYAAKRSTSAAKPQDSAAWARCSRVRCCSPPRR